MRTKTIVLNQMSSYNQKGKKYVRGLVSLQGDENIAGELKLFNLSEEKSLRMLIKMGEKSFLFDEVKADYDFKIVNAPAVDDVFILVAEKDKLNWTGVACGGKEPDDKTQLFEELQQNELDQILAKEDDLEELKILANQKIEPQEKIDNNDERNFYNLIEGQLNELFQRFPRFTNFEELIPNSEWVEVSFSENESEHYLLGKLYSNETVNYICYALPAESSKELPPQSLVEFVQWIPLDVSNPEGRGYWVMYQDAQTGENKRL